ncbi:MAG TPA: type II toxin-antitoxin system VapC family toxin [Thermoanaerobaculia bacterium]|nr:type II toxin-antitoxin system VapC family toxin [Thermoanaerobaculia bacterium]
MRLLLDTHVLLWWLGGDRRLSRTIRDTLRSSDSDIAVSAATIWEIAIKRALGRIDVEMKELLAAIAADGFAELPVRFAHSMAVEALPRHHDDPFDRMLIVQAIAEGRRLVTHDGTILEYAGVAGFDPLRA